MPCSSRWRTSGRRYCSPTTSPLSATSTLAWGGPTAPTGPCGPSSDSTAEASALPGLFGYLRRAHSSPSQGVLQRRAELRDHRYSGVPVGEFGRAHPDLVGALGAEILEQPPTNVAGRPLGPSADDPAVGPDARADVAVAVEQLSTMTLGQVPVPSLPAHRGRVQSGKEGDPWLGVTDRVCVVGKQETDCPVEFDFHQVQRGQG